MAKTMYSYKARNNKGDEINSTMEAESIADLLSKVKAQNLTLVKYAVAKSTDAPKKAEITGTVKMKDVLPFTHHLKTLYSAGVPLISGLEDLKGETSNPYFAQVLDNVCMALKNGSSLSDALAAYPKVFPKIYIALIRVGEATGNLDTALDSLIRFIERREETKGRLVSAMIYPVTLSFAVFCLILVLLLYLLPKIVQVYSDAGVLLPFPTRVIQGASNFLINNALILIVLAIAGVFMIIISRRNPGMRLTTDKWLLNLPLFGPLIIKDNASAFCSTLASLQKSGVDVSDSLGYCEEVLSNHYLKKKIQQVSKAIQEGERFSVAMKATEVFPSLVVTMVKVGDEAGKLDESLQKVCIFYDQEIPNSIKRFLQITENLIIFGAGGIVLFIIMGTLMPIYDLLKIVGKK